MNNNRLRDNLSPMSDLTGRDRIVSNVLFSWGGYIVFVLAGLIMPRMIDHNLGQFSLGIWDFCWSLVSYLSMAQFGVGSSVNRYVAMYRSRNDLDNLCSAVSSVMCVQLVISIFAVFGTAILVWLLPVYFTEKIGSETGVAQWVVALLGMSLAVQMAFDSFRGIITGCHRWDIHNAINVGSHGVTVILMIITLFSGGGLKALSLIYLSTVILTEILRMRLAHWVCPELRIRASYVKWFHAKKMLLFGIKSVIATISPLIIIQTSSLIVVSTLGPSMLAILSRPIALVRHVETIMNKFAFVMTPTSGALHGSGRESELKDFFIKSSYYGTAIVLPITIFIAFFSNIILTAWMGPNYAYGHILTILAIGYFLPASQNSVIRILMGMNLHGKIGLLSLFINLILFIFGIIVLNKIGWSLKGVALLITIPLTIGNGILIPIYACIQLRISLWTYLIRVFGRPFACSFLLNAWLFLINMLFKNNMLNTFVFGTVGGGLIIIILYWRFILTEHLRIKILNIAGEKMLLRWKSLLD